VLKIRFLFDDDQETLVEGRQGQHLFELARSHNLPVQTACVGKGTCGLCRIKVVSGAESLSEYNDVEDKHMGNLYHLTKLRLACQSLIIDEGGEAVVVEIQKRRPKRK
jgi:ferredoxin